jgi:mono/diheme cytochrome c family protein
MVSLAPLRSYICATPPSATFLEITITEGRNRQVRGRLEAVGSKVLKLVRVRLGSLTREGLQIGKYRDLTPEEIKRQKAEAGVPSEKKPRAALASERPRQKRARAGDEASVEGKRQTLLLSWRQMTDNPHAAHVKLTWLAIVLLSFATVSSAQVVMADGEALFRGNCAFCHGTGAKGGRGPNLLATSLRNGNEDADLERVVRNGVKGSSMPDFDFEPEELTALIAYIQSLRKGPATQPVIAGDPKAGQALYAQNGCATCHQIGTAGSVYGPALTRIGSARSYEYLRESITNPSADIPDEFEGVTVVTLDGQRYTGVRINEDTFSIQLRLPDQLFR